MPIGNSEAYSVDFRNVSYSYPRARVATIRDVSFSLAPGDLCVISGPSGSGKSTLIDLMLGLRTASLGEIRIAGFDLSRLSRASIPNLGYVPQAIGLLPGSIRENVIFGRDEDNYSDDEVWAALSRVNLREIVEEQRDGLDTWIGEGGNTLSGGQRQRLGFSRALLGNPSLLVLDEPTSALDEANESLIHEIVRELAGHTTVVVVSHRPGFLQGANQHLVLENGRLVQDRVNR